MKQLYQIVAPYFVVGVVAKDDRVTRAAPIIKYMMEWSFDDIRNYCAKKGWGLRRVGGKR